MQITSRRNFITKTVSVIGAPTIIPAFFPGRNDPGNRVNMAFIGMGNRGIGVMEASVNIQVTSGTSSAQ